MTNTIDPAPIIAQLDAIEAERPILFQDLEVIADDLGLDCVGMFEALEAADWHATRRG